MLEYNYMIVIQLYRILIFSIHNQKSPITLIKFQSNNSTCRATRRKLNSPNTKARHIGLISGHPCQKKKLRKGSPQNPFTPVPSQRREGERHRSWRRKADAVGVQSRSARCLAAPLLIRRRCALVVRHRRRRRRMSTRRRAERNGRRTTGHGAAFLLGTGALILIF